MRMLARHTVALDDGRVSLLESRPERVINMPISIPQNIENIPE